MWDSSRNLRVRKMYFERLVTESQIEIAYNLWGFKINLMAANSSR